MKRAPLSRAGVLNASSLSSLPARLLAVLSFDATTARERLMLEALEEAILALRIARRFGGHDAQHVADEAWAWITRDDGASTFSFMSVCSHFHLDAAWLRDRLVEWQASGRRGSRPSESVPSATVEAFS